MSKERNRIISINKKISDYVEHPNVDTSITKAKVEAVLTGDIDSHNHIVLDKISQLNFNSDGTDGAYIKTTVHDAHTSLEFYIMNDVITDSFKWITGVWDNATGTQIDLTAMTLKALSTTDAELELTGNIKANSFIENGTALSDKYAPIIHGTHLTLGIGAGNAFRGDYGNTAYTHSQSVHAPSNAQKNSDITKAEIEAKLTGTITSHDHSGVYAPVSHGTHLTLGTTSSTAYRGDYGDTAYNHSQTAHAPSNAQKNSDITKAEIEAKLTGTITSHSHTTVNGYSVWTGTQAQYNAISSKSSTTLYFITE